MNITTKVSLQIP